MISYLFNNNNKVDKKYLLHILVDDFGLKRIDNSDETIFLGNSDMFVDIDNRYISILLYNETLNIRPIKKYLMEKYYEHNKRKS